MRPRFYVDELTGNWFRPIVIAIVLLFQSAAGQATEPVRLQETQSESTVHDFQDIKQEAGIWLLIVIFLFAIFCRSPTDKIWLNKDDEEDIGSCQ